MSLTEKQIAFIRLANQNGYMTTISRKDARNFAALITSSGLGGSRLTISIVTLAVSTSFPVLVL